MSAQQEPGVFIKEMADRFVSAIQAAPDDQKIDTVRRLLAERVVALMQAECAAAARGLSLGEGLLNQLGQAVWLTLSRAFPENQRMNVFGHIAADMTSLAVGVTPDEHKATIARVEVLKMMLDVSRIESGDQKKLMIEQVVKGACVAVARTLPDVQQRSTMEQIASDVVTLFGENYV